MTLEDQLKYILQNIANKITGLADCITDGDMEGEVQYVEEIANTIRSAPVEIDIPDEIWPV